MNTRTILEAIDILKKKRKKCSIMEVLEICEQECDTAKEELTDAIDSMTKIGLIERKVLLLLKILFLSLFPSTPSVSWISSCSSFLP